MGGRLINHPGTNNDIRTQPSWYDLKKLEFLAFKFLNYKKKLLKFSPNHKIEKKKSKIKILD
jgi:hypothetical protein